MKFRNINKHDIIKISLLIIIFILLILNKDIWIFIMGTIFPDTSNLIYPRSSFIQLVSEHFLMVIYSSGFATIIGISLGIIVTRKFGRDFLDAVNGLVSLGQTFPPVAVLAIAVPLVGYGFQPTIIALFIYGLLPIVRNTIAGLESVPSDVKEAAKGMGMSPFQIWLKIELPLAFPLIMAGIRTSTIINIGTATLGATVGAGGLGSPIIEGLGRNPAYVIEGAVLVALFAIIIDSLIDFIEKIFSWKVKTEKA